MGMNSPKSVAYGFIALTISGMGAWYISRKDYMADKVKRVEEAKRKYDVEAKEKNVQNDGYVLFDENKTSINKRKS